MYVCIISTLQVPIGTLKVSTGTLSSFAQFYILARFELFLSVFELGILLGHVLDYIPDKTHINLC